MPPRKTGRRRAAWKGQVGHEPHVVHYGERLNKGGRVYLWWRVGLSGQRDWKRRSLGFTVRTASGDIDQALAARAQKEAETQYARLSGRLVAADDRPITLGETWAVLTDERRGKYPQNSAYRKELEHALKFARQVKGDDFPWLAFDPATLQEIIRARAVQVVQAATQRMAKASSGDDDEGPRLQRTGYRAAEMLGTRLITIMTVLRDRDLRIPRNIAVPGGRLWKEELRTYIERSLGVELPETFRPRYTQAEILRILVRSWDVDPRLGFALAIGAEYRGGQVARARRSHLDVEAGTFRIPGRGKKQGTVVHLTKGQRAAVTRALTGYLAGLEALYQGGELADYPLFPGGLLHGRVLVRTEERTEVLRTVRDHADRKPPEKRTWQTWWREAETKAEIEHVPGRGWYGGRRGLLDVGMEAGLVGEALQEHGGWSNTQTPSEVYRDKQRTKARDEAAKIRAQIRGEPLDEPGAPAPSLNDNGPAGSVPTDPEPTPRGPQTEPAQQSTISTTEPTRDP